MRQFSFLGPAGVLNLGICGSAELLDEIRSISACYFETEPIVKARITRRQTKVSIWKQSVWE